MEGLTEAALVEAIAEGVWPLVNRGSEKAVALAALAAIRAAGWCVVPVVPTEVMLEAVSHAWPSEYHDPLHADQYAAMLAASPLPPEPGA